MKTYRLDLLDETMFLDYYIFYLVLLILQVYVSEFFASNYFFVWFIKILFSILIDVLCCLECDRRFLLRV
jgi:hypothetical protein